MELRRLIISLWDNRRIVLYPEGGLELEYLEPGIGWVLDNDAHVDDSALADMLLQARNVVADAAAKMVDFQVAGSIGSR